MEQQNRDFKHIKEALQVTKELMGKFIETRTVSPSNFGEIFPAVYDVVLSTISPLPKGEQDMQGVMDLNLNIND